MVGVCFLDAVDDDLLADTVGLGYKLVFVFDGDLDVAHFFHCSLACEAGGDDGGFEQSSQFNLFQCHIQLSGISFVCVSWPAIGLSSWNRWGHLDREGQ